MHGFLLGGVAMVLMAGCGPAPGPSGGDPGVAKPASMEPLRQQAREALARYHEAIQDAGGEPRFAPIGGLSGQLGDWEPHNGDNKLKLSTGSLVAAGPLPGAPEPTGTVAFEDGRTREVPLLSADAALDRLKATGTGDCPGCVPLKVTGARLTTARILTMLGPATVPIWEYPVEGSKVRLTRLAVADQAVVTVDPPPWDPSKALGAHAVQSASTTRDGRELAVTFYGSPGPASEPCGADYATEAVESAEAVAVIVTGRARGTAEMCPAIAAWRTETVRLDRPLGQRAVLETQQGTPVEVTITG
ncbi:hypothetical protein [Micromonospora sp. NPDC023737]|uniref:hypothetical protein n=1 Tax=unclassified Micromonospora TaxID=2617518 RepID=UPI0033F3FECB